MTLEADPPRFGTLSDKLPAELVAEVVQLRDVEAPPAELERIGARLRARLAANAERGRRAVRPRKRLFGGTLGLALTLAIGAAAGGVVSAGLYVEHRWIEPKKIGQPVAVGPGERPARAPSASALPASGPALRVPASEASVPVASAASPDVAAGRAVSSAVHSAHGSGGAAAAPDPAQEVALLARARAALESDPGKALALTNEHERMFTRGVLTQEREVIAIDALLRLGRRAEARARADRFHRVYPESTHGRRVELLFEIR